MPKKANEGITPENFLDSYRPITPGRGNPSGDSEAKAELPKVEKGESEKGVGENIPILSSRPADKAMTVDEYAKTFLAPNFGRGLRSGGTINIHQDDRKIIRDFLSALGGNYDKVSVSLFVHNLIIHHLATFRSIMLEMVAKNTNPNSFIPKK